MNTPPPSDGAFIRPTSMVRRFVAVRSSRAKASEGARAASISGGARARSVYSAIAMRSNPAPLFACLSLLFAGCAGGYSGGAAGGAPAAPSSDTEEGRRALAERQATRELACDEAHVVATIDRRYANSASVRYVVEGCGHRALYVEDCSRESTCRYLLVSVVPVAPAPAAAPAASTARP